MIHKLYRDRVISLVDVNGEMKSLVGVYVKIKPVVTNDPAGMIDNGSYKSNDEVLLAEFPVKKADKIIKLWNGR